MTNLDSIYLAMYPHLMRYKVGHIDLLELLSEWERILGIQQEQTDQASQIASPPPKKKIA